MQLAFKNAVYGGFPWFDGIYGFGISLRNWLSGDFNTKAHVELVFTAKQYMIDYLQKAFPGQFLKLKVGQPISYSSIEGDTNELGQKTSGARFKAITYAKWEEWDFLPWNIRDQRFPRCWRNIEHLFAFCAKRVGMVGYDWLGILGQAVGVEAVEDAQSTFCSEEVAEILGFEMNPSPASLYSLVRSTLSKPIKGV